MIDKQKARERGRRWREANRGRDRELKRNYYHRNREKFLAKFRKEHFDSRMKLLDVLGEECSGCGFSDKRVLQVDHVNGLAGEKRLKKPSKLLLDVKNNPGKYQLLCANCNWLKYLDDKQQ